MPSAKAADDRQREAEQRGPQRLDRVLPDRRARTGWSPRAILLGAGRMNGLILNSQHRAFPDREHDEPHRPTAPAQSSRCLCRSVDVGVALMPLPSPRRCSPRSSCTISLNSLGVGEVDRARPWEMDVALHDRPCPAVRSSRRCGRRGYTASRRSCVTRITVIRFFCVQVAHHLPQLLARERVECAERLVEHQTAWGRGSARGTGWSAAACRPTAARGISSRSP